MRYCQSPTQSFIGEYQEKGSRFMAHLFPVAYLEDFQNILNQFKKEHPKARHLCYAYRLGALGEHYRANDDGEPSGSAGLPIYQQMLSFNASDCAIIVIRYFGGTLLGVPGLIRSYKTSALYALEKASWQMIIPKMHFEITIAYPQINTLMQLIKQCQLTIIQQEINNHCYYLLEGEQDKSAEILNIFHHAQLPLSPLITAET